MTNATGVFPHHQKNGDWVMKPITTKPVAERIAPRRQADPKGPLGTVLLGSYVRGRSAWTNEGIVSGQVWSACGLLSGRYWWVVTSEGTAHPMHESNMTLLAKRDEDAPLFEDGAA